MKAKIEQYLKFVFKQNEIENQEMFDEIYGNLIERYDDLISKGLSEDNAYYETISTLGDFEIEEVEVKQKYTYKVNWANISLWIALGIAILSTILLLITTEVSAVLTAVSVALIIGSSYYLYHSAKFALKEEKDVSKHNSLISEMFTNLKVTTIFISINISYWIAAIINNIIVLPFAERLIEEGLLESFEKIRLINTTLAIMFIVIFVLIFVILRVVYNKVANRVMKETGGEVALDAKISKKTKLIISIVGIVIYALVILLHVVRIGNGFFDLEFGIFTTPMIPGSGHDFLADIQIALVLLTIPVIIYSLIRKRNHSFIIFGMLVFADLIFQTKMFLDLNLNGSIEFFDLPLLRIALLIITLTIFVVLSVLKIIKYRKRKLTKAE